VRHQSIIRVTQAYLQRRDKLPILRQPAAVADYKTGLAER
jgi:hypothetical protein